MKTAKESTLRRKPKLGQWVAIGEVRARVVARCRDPLFGNKHPVEAVLLETENGTYFAAFMTWRRDGRIGTCLQAEPCNNQDDALESLAAAETVAAHDSMIKSLHRQLASAQGNER